MAVVPIGTGYLRAVGSVVPISRAASFVPKVAGLVVPAGTAGLTGAVSGVALPLLGAFATGFEIGTQLLRLWNYLNQGQAGAPVNPIGETDPSKWPQPGPGQTLRYGVGVWGAPRQQGASLGRRMFGLQDSGTPAPAIVQDFREFQNPDLFRYRVFLSGFEQGDIWGPPGPEFRLESVQVIAGGGSVPQVLGPSQPGPSRAPLTRALPAATPRTAPTAPPARPPQRKDPLAPPLTTPAPKTPGTPVPTPATPAPVTPPAPGQPVRPGESPAPGRAPTPQRFPTKPGVAPAQPTLPDGTPAPAELAPVTPTPQDTVFYPNLAVGGPAQAPRPDLGSMAKELGRMEQKLGGLLGGLGVPESFDRLQELLDLLPSQVDGVTYQLAQPCGTDANGQPLPPLEVEVLSQPDANRAILSRLDAIAYLLDLHKQTRQPLCKGKPAGEPVTVTFQEMP